MKQSQLPVGTAADTEENRQAHREARREFLRYARGSRASVFQYAWPSFLFTGAAGKLAAVYVLPKGWRLSPQEAQVARLLAQHLPVYLWSPGARQLRRLTQQSELPVYFRQGAE